MPPTEMMTRYENDDLTTDTNNVLGESDTFLAKVLHRVQGSHLPFIFQIDSTTAASDGFALARFDQKRFNLKQVAPNIYNLSLKISETW